MILWVMFLVFSFLCPTEKELETELEGYLVTKLLPFLRKTGTHCENNSVLMAVYFVGSRMENVVTS